MEKQSYHNLSESRSFLTVYWNNCISALLCVSQYSYLLLAGFNFLISILAYPCLIRSINIIDPRKSYMTLRQE